MRCSLVVCAAILLVGSSVLPASAQKATSNDTDRVVRTIIVSDANNESTSSTPVDTSEAATTVRPGAPGEPSRRYNANRAAAPQATDADIRFMQHMIPHHAQALDMTALVAERTDDRALRQLARRIELAQADEIAQMAGWLADHEAEVPPLPAAVDGPDSAPVRDPSHAMNPPMQMEGMLNADQMQQLADATGERFERLFLEFMIMHHEGAITMVETLYKSDRGGQTSTVNALAMHIESAQVTEIARMRQMLAAYE